MKTFERKEPAKGAQETDPREIMMKHCSDNGLLNMRLGKSILNAMEEYALQFKRPAITKESEPLTDEDIKAKAEELYLRQYSVIFEEGAKWYRDRNK